MTLAANQEYIEEKYAAVMSYLGAREQLRTIPSHIDCILNDIRVSEAARDHQIKSVAQAAIVLQAKRLIEMEVVPMAQRRLFEQRLAYMLAREVIPRYGMIDPALKDLPAKLTNCRTSGKIGVDVAGDKKFFWESKCNCTKLCPDEMRYEGERLSERYIPAIMGVLAKNRRARLQKFVISPRNVPYGRLADVKAKIFQTWANINRRSVCKNLIGSLVVQEDPKGINDNFNVHLNVMAIVNGHFDWKLFRQTFKEMYGDLDVQIEITTEDNLPNGRPGMRTMTENQLRRHGQLNGQVTREQVLVHAMHEMVKYVCKIVGSDHPSSRDSSAAGSQGPTKALEAQPMDEWPGSVWYEWYRANKGFRRTRSYGELYNTPEPQPEDLNVEWFGFIKWQELTSRYEISTPSIDLIPADKFTEMSRGFEDYPSTRGRPP